VNEYFPHCSCYLSLFPKVEIIKTHVHSSAKSYFSHILPVGEIPSLSSSLCPSISLPFPAFPSPAPPMAALCICGVCIPYSFIWPIILFAFKEVYSFFFGGKKSDSSPVSDSGLCCKDGVCELPAKKDDNIKESNADLNVEKKKQIQTESQIVKSDEEFQSIINQTSLVFVRFTATWCKPCKEIQPLFEELCKNHSESASFLSVDIDEWDELAVSLKVHSIPSFLCFQNGSVVDRFTGKDEEKLKSFVQSRVEKQQWVVLDVCNIKYFSTIKVFFVVNILYIILYYID
jgi:thioredoxin 1